MKRPNRIVITSVAASGVIGAAGFFVAAPFAQPALVSTSSQESLPIGDPTANGSVDSGLAGSDSAQSLAALDAQAVNLRAQVAAIEDQLNKAQQGSSAVAVAPASVHSAPALAPSTSRPITSGSRHSSNTGSDQTSTHRPQPPAATTAPTPHATTGASGSTGSPGSSQQGDDQEDEHDGGHTDD